MLTLLTITAAIWLAANLSALTIPLMLAYGKKLVRWIFGRTPKRMPESVLEAILEDVNAMEPAIRRNRTPQAIQIKGHIANGIPFIDSRRLLWEN